MFSSVLYAFLNYFYAEDLRAWAWSIWPVGVPLFVCFCSLFYVCLVFMSVFKVWHMHIKERGGRQNQRTGFSPSRECGTSLHSLRDTLTSIGESPTVSFQSTPLCQLSLKWWTTSVSSATIKRKCFTVFIIVCIL